jgi:hypothetical protein
MDKIELVDKGLKLCKWLDKELYVNICCSRLGPETLIKPKEHILIGSEKLGSLQVRYLMINSRLKDLIEITGELSLPSEELLKDIISNDYINHIYKGLTVVENLVSKNIDMAVFKTDRVIKEQLDYLNTIRTIVRFTKTDINKAKSTL